MIIGKKDLLLPLTAQLEITEQCNYKCLHCYNVDSNVVRRTPREVNRDTVLQCASKLIENNIFSVAITGGEPLTDRPLAKQVIKLFKENGVNVSINTNLTLIDDDFIEFLKQEKVPVLTSCPTIDPLLFKSLTKADKYHIFESNLKKLNANGVRHTVNMVVTKDNIEEIRTTAYRLKEIGVVSMGITPMSLNMDYPRKDLLLSDNQLKKLIDDLLWIENNLGLYVDIFEGLPKCCFDESLLLENHRFLKRKCQAGRTTIAVACSGEVKPCPHNSVSYGNILNSELADIWKKMEDWRSVKYLPHTCIRCNWVNSCNGGCRTNAKAYHGNWISPDVWSKKPPKIQPAQLKSIEINDNSLIKFSSEYKIRNNDADTIVVYNSRSHNFLLVNEHFYTFIKRLKDMSEIKYIELKEEVRAINDDSQLLSILSILKEKKFISIH
ncbi:radical SAM protein [Vibrio parahaemolyticus]|nr:radical SAM protein [Vibrio parahaemolyticus]MBM4909423.1 radical SAM protein [Vibrio parahaemolyticus]MBM5096007.1 radical SAM protein [Vibrio parahaemolyticus]MBM5418669.1 radical SAM protein [Vibrio parahaemolyticus]MCF9098318.1 radical SAM protein [Vibrio parahaemolyticus]